MSFRVSGPTLTIYTQAVFHDYIAKMKNIIFTGAAEVIMGRLSQAAIAVGEALAQSLAELARKVCSLCHIFSSRSDEECLE